MNFHSSEQTISWFRDRAREGTLDLRPPFQRRPVWTLRQKCQLVESVLLHLPIPELFMQVSSTPEGDTKYSVVDGQQRIRSILEFIGLFNGRDEADDNRYSLSYLEPGSPWYNLSFDDLEGEEKTAFFQHKLSVRSLENTSDSELRDMFRRLNKYLSKLTAQELRNAIYTGPFIRQCEDLAEDEYWATNGIVSPALIRRMGDVEFVSELVIGCLHGPQSGRPTHVDEYYRQYEEAETEFPGQPGAKRLFRRTLDAIQSILPDIRQSRWRNRADFYSLFVATAHLFRDKRLHEAEESRVREALDAFSADIDQVRQNEQAKVPLDVKRYVQGLARGSNDKSRRAMRHEVLVHLLERHFRPTPGRPRASGVSP